MCLRPGGAGRESGAVVPEVAMLVVGRIQVDDVRLPGARRLVLAALTQPRMARLHQAAADPAGAQSGPRVKDQVVVTRW